MPTNRIVYQNWIVELGFDPLIGPEARESEPADPGPGDNDDNERVLRIRETVRQALAELTEDERELIERLHFMGQTFPELAESSGRAVHRLEAMYNRAVRKLRRSLAPLVAEMYGLRGRDHPACPICASPHRKKIDGIIRTRDPQKTWRPVIQEIRRRFGIKIGTPQILIGHVKYH